MTIEEANLTIDYLKEMQESYIEGEGYERHPLPEWYALDKAIEAVEQTMWIPVSERLPKDGQIVLFCDIDDDIMVGYHVKGRPDTHFTQDGTFEDMKNVKAWMPLPEPYEAESEEE